MKFNQCQPYIKKTTATKMWGPQIMGFISYFAALHSPSNGTSPRLAEEDDTTLMEYAFQGNWWLFFSQLVGHRNGISYN